MCLGRPLDSECGHCPRAGRLAQSALPPAINAPHHAYTHLPIDLLASTFYLTNADRSSSRSRTARYRCSSTLRDPLVDSHPGACPSMPPALVPRGGVPVLPKTLCVVPETVRDTFAERVN